MRTKDQAQLNSSKLDKHADASSPLEYSQANPISNQLRSHISVEIFEDKSTKTHKQEKISN